jgi:hypothetical protein
VYVYTYDRTAEFLEQDRRVSSGRRPAQRERQRSEEGTINGGGRGIAILSKGKGKKKKKKKKKINNLITKLHRAHTVCTRRVRVNGGRGDARHSSRGITRNRARTFFT